MSNRVLAEVLKLPADERLHLVEVLWESLAAEPSAVQLSEAHCAALDEELAEHQRNLDDVLDLDQVLPEVRRPR